MNQFTGVAALQRLLQTSGALQPYPATKLATNLGISQPTLSRWVKAAGDSVIRIGAARASSYASRRQIRGSGSAWPVFRLLPDGKAQALGTLTAVARDAWYWLPQNPAPSAWTRGSFANGWFPGWPWWLDDQRPQGFLGRSFARRVAGSISAPIDPKHWRDEDIALALLNFGSDAPGDWRRSSAVHACTGLRHAANALATRRDR
jgi:hypothetical protein